jgi:NNP family nitrate/nitrite transporter-like MFS transporter
VLGGAAGATFALVARVAPRRRSAVSPASWGLRVAPRRIRPPLVMGALYGATGATASYLLLLAVVALTAAAYTWLVLRRESRTT